jgi:HK97 family phage major capsid protein
MAHLPTRLNRAPPADAADAFPRKSFPGFLKAVRDRDHRTLERVYGTGYDGSARQVTKAPMNLASGAAGGYLVPQEYTAKLLQVISEESFIFPRADVVPFDVDTVNVPRVDVETVPAAAGTSPFFGGGPYTRGSEQAPAETEPKFRSLTLKAWDLIGYAVVSNQFLADTGPTGEEYLINLLGKAAAWQAEYAFLQGKGAGDTMPLGILNSPATLAIAARATAGHIKLADVVTMTASLMPGSWDRAVWATHPTCLADIQQLGPAGGGVSYVINVDTSAGPSKPRPVGMLSARPLFVTEKLPALGTRGDLVLFDPYRYVIGLRQQVLVDVSTQAGSLFATNQTAFRVWLRLDGKPQLSSTVTLQDTSTVVSPFVLIPT